MNESLPRNYHDQSEPDSSWVQGKPCFLNLLPRDVQGATNDKGSLFSRTRISRLRKGNIRCIVDVFFVGGGSE